MSMCKIDICLEPQTLWFTSGQVDAMLGKCANGNKSADFRWNQVGVAVKCSRRCVISPDDYEELIDPNLMKDKDRSLLDRVLAPFHC